VDLLFIPSIADQPTLIARAPAARSSSVKLAAFWQAHNPPERRQESADAMPGLRPKSSPQMIARAMDNLRLPLLYCAPPKRPASRQKINSRRLIQSIRDLKTGHDHVEYKESITLQAQGAEQIHVTPVALRFAIRFGSSH
jgi:hypothetical protein